jgi:hypothetical protein
MSADLWATAIHEAAHVTIAYTHPPPRALTATVHDRHHGPVVRPRSQRRRIALVCLAGPCAEARIAGGEFAKHRDWDLAADQFLGTGIGIRDAWHAALGLVDRHRLAIWAVAQALEAERRLDGRHRSPLVIAFLPIGGRPILAISAPGGELLPAAGCSCDVDA